MIPGVDAGFTALVRATRGMLLMRNKGVVQIIAGLVLGICAWIPATAQKANIQGGNMLEPVVPSRVVERIADDLTEVF